MGEYARRKSDGEEVKIGTCESMYYLRYEDRDKVDPLPNSLDPETELDLFWRLPFPDEDNVPIGEYQDYDRAERLYKTNDRGWAEDFEDPELDTPGIMQLRHPCGLLLNVRCYHGAKLPQKTEEITPFWNGRSWFLELAHIKNTSEGIKATVRCRHCHEMWRYELDEILPYVGNKELRKRLEKHLTKSQAA